MPRPKGPVSPATAEKNRINGTLYGGCNPIAMPPEILERLGEPPVDDDLELRRWYAKGLALLTYLQAKGMKGIKQLARDFRQNAGTAAKLTPYDVIFAAQRKLREDEEELGTDTAGDEDEEETRAVNGSKGARADA